MSKFETDIIYRKALDPLRFMKEKTDDSMI